MLQGIKGNSLIKSLVIVSDFVIINIMLITCLVSASATVPSVFHTATKIVFFILNMSMAISQFMFSTIIHFRNISYASIFKQTLKLTILCSAIFFTSIKLLWPDNGGVFDFMIIFTPAAFVMLYLSRIAERSALKSYRSIGGNTASVVFVGNDPANIALYHQMKDCATGYRIIGYFADEVIQDTDSEFRHLGTISDLHGLMDSCTPVSESDKKELSKELSDKARINRKNLQLSAVNEIFCSLSHSRNSDITAIMRFCDRNVIRFYYVPRMAGNFLLNLKPDKIGGLNVYTNHMEPLADMTNSMEKRAFDIIFSSLVCLLVILPMLPIIAIIIKIQSPGPLFFKQLRTGIDGKVFNCLKFRSMHVNKDSDTQQATKNDPRKFPFGNFMRKTNIDELPQFINVLKGDMSIVGPRPHMLKHTKEYGKIIDKYMVRHFCKPGITGFAQVTGFRGETKEVWQMEGRIKRDIWYIENWSFALDLRIIFQTAKSIIVPDKNAY